MQPFFISAGDTLEAKRRYCDGVFCCSQLCVQHSFHGVNFQKRLGDLLPKLTKTLFSSVTVVPNPPFAVVLQKINRQRFLMLKKALNKLSPTGTNLS